MSGFKDFEREAVKLLVGKSIPDVRLNSLLDSAEVVSYDHTGAGYFLTVRHPAVPSKRVVCDRPLIVGRVGDIECGFVVFLEGGALTLECHSWGDNEILEGFRELQVEIATAA